MLSAQPARARRFRGRSPGFNASGTSAGAVIPFDHAATFELRGIPGNIVQGVVNVSTDGTFVAVAIGYGFEEDRARRAELLTPRTTQAIGDITLSQIPTIALIEGFRLNPQLNRVAFDVAPPLSGGRQSPQREPVLSNNQIVTTFSNSIIEHIKPAEDISFLFSIVDSATGRELQDEPINNLASLGASDGKRPFRLLAQPLTFQPRSTVRLQIVERSEGLTGTLFIVLYGYKILGANRETPVRPALSYPGSANGDGSARIIPFDYVSKFLLTGEPGNLIEDEVPINTEGGFVATSIGYGLSVQSLAVSLSDLDDDSNDLSSLELRQFPTSALQDGIRIRPNFIRLAFQNDGTLRTQNVTGAAANQMFERLNRPESVSFRYSIADTGTGRDLQNQPINNVAGLGIATGERPFKRLARPMSFLPRSTVRVVVEEQFGRGMLSIVFQGYKVLSAGKGTQPQTSRRRTRRR